MTGTCKREFASLTAFDAHQSWDYTRPPGDQLTCLDPTTLLATDGTPRFRINTRGRWGSASAMPSGAFPVARQTPSQGFPVPSATADPVRAAQGLTQEATR